MRTFVLFIALSSIRLFAAGAWPLEFFTSDPKAVIEAAQKVPSPDGVDVFVIDAQFQLRVDAEGRLARTSRFLFRVVTDRGTQQMAHYSEAWLAWRQDKPALKVRVITPDAQAHLLDPSTITEAGIPNQVEGVFTDTKIIAAPLPGVATGALIEVEMQLNDREIVGGLGNASHTPLLLSVGHLRAMIDIPAGTPLHIATPALHGIQRKDSQEGGRQKVSLEGSDLEPQQLNLAPGGVPWMPEIVFSTVSDWKRVAQWYFDTSELQIGVKQPAVADAAARMAEIETILAGIQKSVRYTGIEFGMAAYVPRSPQQTLARGFGDCKDKAALLVNRLRSAGIAANLALLTPYPGNDVPEDVPGVEMFSHAIVYVPGTHPFFIDPTSEFTPARRLPAADQGRLALIVDPATTGLTRTTMSKPQDNGSSQIFMLNLAEEGKAKVTYTLDSYGSMEDATRTMGSQWLAVPETQRNDSFKRFDPALGAEKTTSVDWGNPKDLSGDYRVTVKADGYKNSGGTEQSVYAYVPQSLQQPLPLAQLLSTVEEDEKATKKRAGDYDLVFGFVANEQWRVVPPAGFKVRNLPDMKDRELGPLTVRRKVSLDKDGSVLFNYRLELKPRYTIAEAKQIREAAKQLALIGTLQVEFKPEGTMLMSEGKWKEGIDLLRRDASTNPIRTGPGLRYAAVLLEAGLRDEAAKLCRKVIEADPKSARAYAYLSLVDRYDPIGRPEKAPIDLADAEKSIQKAAELDPANKRYVLDRALIKELDAAGVRYENPQGLAEAIGLLEGISADLPGIQQPNALVDALFRARRFADLKALYDKPEGRSARLDMKFVAIAGADGSAAAIREAQTLPSDSSRKTTLQAAARDLILVGEYAKAADLVEASGDPATRVGADLLRHAGSHGQIPLSRDPVIAVVQQYIFALFDHLAVPKYDDLLTPEWKVFTFAAQRAQLLSFFSAYRNVVGQSLGTRHTADIVVGNVELVKEGNDATGYRVRFADPASNGAMKTISWVVRRGDVYKILGLRADVSTGAEALALAKKGDLDAARKWLNWMREETTPNTNPDILATSVFTRLWTDTDAAEKDQILIGAAAIIAGSRYGNEALELLRTLRDKAKNDSQGEVIDQIIGAGLFAQQVKLEEQISIAERLYKAHPTSPLAINMVGSLLINAGNTEAALRHAASVKPVDDAGIAAVARVRGHAHQARHEYVEAMESFRTLCNSNKCSPVDWNNLAWLSLFVPGKVAPDIKSAETSVRLTQERNLASIHTLASIQADLGKLKEARAGLLRYLGTNDRIDESAWYLEGRIAEGLGLKEVAADVYSKISAPPRTVGDSAYDLAQVRLGAMRAPLN